MGWKFFFEIAIRNGYYSDLECIKFQQETVKSKTVLLIRFSAQKMFIDLAKIKDRLLNL